MRPLTHQGMHIDEVEHVRRTQLEQDREGQVRTSLEGLSRGRKTHEARWVGQ